MAAVIALGTAVIWEFVGLHVISGSGSWWRIASVAGYGLVVAAPILVIQRPAQRAYRAALDDLSSAQRSCAARAIRRGAIPTDPAVLAAAIRVRTLTAAYRNSASRLQKAVPWLLPVLYVLLALSEISDRDMRRITTSLGLALLFAILAVWNRYTGKRLNKRLALLRSAATAHGVPTADESRVPTPRPKAWHQVAAAIVVIVATAALAITFARPSADCHTVDDLVRYIAEHGDMLDGRLITPGGPSLEEYQGWADQLSRYSARVSAADLAPHLHRIAELSGQAVASVRDERTEFSSVPRVPGADDTPADTQHKELAYRSVVEQLISEEKAAIDICHRR